MIADEKIAHQRLGVLELAQVLFKLLFDTFGVQLIIGLRKNNITA